MRAGISSARRHGDKDRTIAQQTHFSIRGDIERSTNTNDVIDPSLERGGHGVVVHRRCDDHDI